MRAAIGYLYAYRIRRLRDPAESSDVPLDRPSNVMVGMGLGKIYKRSPYRAKRRTGL